ncbi:ankyrin, partial [Eremomyces bilateralis CBS 781.70]
MLCQQPKTDDEWPFPLDSHRTIARKCLSYISLLVQQGPVELPKSADRRSDLLSYSVRHWPSHYKEDIAGRAPDSNTEQGESQEFDVFNDHDLIQKWAQLYFDSDPPGMACESTHPLVVSVEVGCSDLVRALLKGQTHSSDILKTALETAIKTGDESLIRMLLASGATSDIALHVVAMSGKPSLLELFHKTEDDLKSENSQGFTPLHCACQSGYLSTVEELLRIRSDAKAKSNITGQTPLHTACQFGHLEIIARLLASDANANEEDKSGFTPLH